MTLDPLETPAGFLVGQKVMLRGLRREDMPLYRAWLENTQVTHLMESGWRPLNDAEVENLYRASTEPNDTVVFVMVDRATDRPIGTCGLYLIQWICRRAEFRIIIGEPTAWNKGFGSEAARLVVACGFERLNLETIYLGVNTENLMAIRSYERAGFVREGVRRKLIFRNGRYYDALMMSILREEYAGRPA
jgi:RimJ/RimL family protein N-acetyltransferase